MQPAWDVLQGMLDGSSSLDVDVLPFNTREQAEQFLQAYGYDWQCDQHQRELIRIQAEAITFIEQRFLQSISHWDHFWADTDLFSIPSSIKYQMDTLDLMLKASETQGTDALGQAWACAIFKMMHVICHVENAVLNQFLETARQQILPKFEAHLFHHPETNKLCLGKLDDAYLPIKLFQSKDGKSRDSLITKLICKKESVAEQVLDLIGVRIVTETPEDAVLALELLRHYGLIVFANLISSRTRNRLLDTTHFVEEAKAKSLPMGAACDLLWHKAGIEAFRDIKAPLITSKATHDNRSSHHEYRAIHLTARQLIRLPIADGSGAKPKLEHRVFFPYEIQLVDQDNYQQNHQGDSAHVLYKRKQLIRARRRILGRLLALHRQSQTAKTYRTQLFSLL